MRPRIIKKVNDKNFFATKQLGWYISKISKPFFNRQGFIKSYIIDNWKEIVGETYYQRSIPEKLKIQKGGGVLIIAADGATSTEMEYYKLNIIKKINDYYGYRAVSRIRFRNTILQNQTINVKNKENTDKNYEIKDKNLDVEISKFEDGELRETLISLGNKILGKQIIPIREENDE